MQTFRFSRASIILAVYLGLTLAGCATSAKKNPWIAPSDEQALIEKVKIHRNAYLRYSQAEEEARKDNVPVAVERYARAKAAAKHDMEEAERELSAYEAGKGAKAPK